MFTGKLGYPDDSIETNERGLRFIATAYTDSDHGAPWDEEDGHGEVSDWTSRAKGPGELILAEDRDSHRYYDYSQACHIARKDGWGTRDGKRDGETPIAYAARAAREDFDRMRAWCADEWCYVGVVVECYAEGIKLGSAGLWGIESDAGEYLTTVANELLPECETEARKTLAKLCQHNGRITT